MEKEKVEEIVNGLKERLDYSNPERTMEVYFPWNDVLDSMLRQPEKVRISDTLCPECGEHHIELYFSSPDWTWRNLCGRAGTMKICSKCEKQVDFCLEVMN